MEDGKQKLAFWLMPSGSAVAHLTSLVEELARRLDAPSFEPHVTLYGGELQQERGIELLESIARTHAPLELQIGGIETSEKYTKTVYVQFQPSGEASAISDEIKRSVGSDNGYEFDPHLSLLYKTMPEAQKQELAREISLPCEKISFDAVKLISVPRAIERAEDVHAWRPVAQQTLR